MTAAVICVAAALLLLGGLGIWAGLEHARRTRAFLFNAEIDLLRSHAERTHRYLATYLQEQPEGFDLAAALAASKLRDAWRNSQPAQPKRLYSAIVAPSGRILMHSEKEKTPVGASLEADWSGEPTLREGAAIALTTSPVLADGRRAYDLSFPVVRSGREIATYHTGLDADWLDAQTEEPARQTLLLWAGVIIGMAAIVVTTSVCLYYLVKNAALTHELEMAHLQRAMEQNELARGLAHEIRNPLNAVRLNLHIFERFLEHPEVLSREEIRRVLSDSLRETMQIETLVSELLGFVRSGPPQMEDLELGEVATAAIEFFRPSCAEAELIGPRFMNGASLPVCGDRTHVRQVVLNLLRNAHEAAGPEGRIELTLSKEHGRATLSVADNGPPVPPSDLETVFEPFYSGRSRNLGLSLALVRKHILEAGGHVWCESPDGAGAKFCVQLPLREK